ncbi:BCCT family transporter [Algoriphagus aestuariicola]
MLQLSGVALLLFLGYAVFSMERLAVQLADWTTWVLAYFGDYYLILGLGAVLTLGILAALPLGKIRLGEGPPEFGWFTWIAMLYSTGMGGGLMLRAVQEPVFYFLNPPRETHLDTKVFALEYTFFHWGFTPWAFYGLMALIVAYNLYQKGGPALGSSSLLGNKTHPVWSMLMDFLLVLCTLFGVVAGVGLGSRQLLEAIMHWTGRSFSSETVLIPITLLSVVSMISAYFGVRRGISLLSNLTIGGASLLLIFAWLSGAPLLSLKDFILGLEAYLIDFIPMSLNLGKAKVGDEFLRDWTYFYWAFWLAWAPFTGVFIARISKGRSIRELILGTLLVPSLGTFFWFAVFGGNSFQLLQTGIVDKEAFSSIYSSLLNYFSVFPFSHLSNFVATFLVAAFLITSIDSAIFVLSMFTDEGKTEPRPGIRIFWGVSILVFTALLVLLGKDRLLEAVSNLLILFALPFSFVFVLLAIQLFRKLGHMG